MEKIEKPGTHSTVQGVSVIITAIANSSAKSAFMTPRLNSTDLIDLRMQVAAEGEDPRDEGATGGRRRAWSQGVVGRLRVR